MNNTFKLIGIIAFVTVIGFSFPSCGESDSSGGGGNVTNEKAVYTSIDGEGNVYELTITPKSDKAAYEPKAGDLFKLVITLVSGTMKTSEGTVANEVKSGSTMTITLSVSGSASFSVSVSNDKDEASAIKEINGSIPITESSDGDTSSVDVSDSPLVPYVPVSLTPAEIASYLAKQPANTASSPNNISVKVSDSEELSIIKTALTRAPDKYVRLDLSGSTVTSIKDSAFYSCRNLASIIIPDSVTSIGNMTFNYCESLTSVTLPNSLTSIGFQAFSSTGLISVIIPNSVTTIGRSAFYMCEKLTSVTIPNSVTSIGESTFTYCSSLESVTIPESVTSIGRNSFGACVSLIGINVNSDNNSYSSDNGILYNKNKTTLMQCPGGKIGTFIIPNSVTSIGEYSFFHCDSLTSVTILDNVTSIDEGAFFFCKKLATLTIGSGVSSIGKDAFGACDGLTSVTFQGTIPSSGFYRINWGNLRDKFYETDKTNGTPGTYTTRDGGWTWTLQQ